MLVKEQGDLQRQSNRSHFLSPDRNLKSSLVQRVPTLKHMELAMRFSLVSPPRTLRSAAHSFENFHSRRPWKDIKGWARPRVPLPFRTLLLPILDNQRQTRMPPTLATQRHLINRISSFRRT